MILTNLGYEILFNFSLILKLNIKKNSSFDNVMLKDMHQKKYLTSSVMLKDMQQKRNPLLVKS